MNIKTPQLTWKAAYNRWKAHEVRQISLIKRPGEVPYSPQRWANKNGSDSMYIYGNPANGTARHLAIGLVTQAPEMFAAFAMHTFLVQKEKSHCELGLLMKETIQKYDDRCGDYWHSNAKRLLPFEGDRRLDPDERDDWKGWIDAAARVWARLESDYSVLTWTGDDEVRRRLLLRETSAGG